MLDSGSKTLKIDMDNMSNRATWGSVEMEVTGGGVVYPS